MSKHEWTGGIGEPLGDSFITSNGTVTQSGELYYVLYSTGSDSNDGRDRVKPLKTLGAAVAAANPGDTIVLLDGHDETITTMIQFTDAKAGLMVMGAGRSGGRPSVKLTNNCPGTNMIQVVTYGLVFANIYFTGLSPVACPNPRIDVLGTGSFGCSGTTFRGCLFEMGANDTGACMQLEDNASFGRLESCQFVSVATVATAEPLAAIVVASGKDVWGWVFEDVLFDGGAAGFSRFWAFDASAAGSNTLFRFERISLVRGADMKFAPSDTGHLQVGSARLGARVTW